MENDSSHKELRDLLRQNSDLVKENNLLLKKIHLNIMWTFWIRVVWYAILIGLPFALYFVFEPYFTALGSDYETFKAGIREIPGLKGINTMFNTSQ